MNQLLRRHIRDQLLPLAGSLHSLRRYVQATLLNFHVAMCVRLPCHAS